MLYDLTAFPVGPNGKKFVDETGNECTYKELLISLCGSGLGENGQPLQGKAKLKFYDIYLKIQKANGTLELTAEEAALLSSAALNQPVILAGQMVAFIDGKGAKSNDPS